jgi:hypothetical protein
MCANRISEVPENDDCEHTERNRHVKFEHKLPEECGVCAYATRHASVSTKNWEGPDCEQNDDSKNVINFQLGMRMLAVCGVA